MQSLLESLEFVCLDSEDPSSTQERELLYLFVSPDIPAGIILISVQNTEDTQCWQLCSKEKRGEKQMVEGETGSYGESFRNL